MARTNTEEGSETPQNAAEQQAEEQPSIVESVIDAASSALNTVVETVADGIEVVADAVGFDGDRNANQRTGKRAQKIGVVSSDKMTKTVVVRVDRQVMHPKYRRYIRRTTKFMAHDETGAGVGDKVRIEESRPLSARKRWRVVEIIQKAAK